MYGPIVLVFFLFVYKLIHFLDLAHVYFSQTEQVPKQRPVPMPRTPKVQSSLIGAQFNLTS